MEKPLSPVLTVEDANELMGRYGQTENNLKLRTAQMEKELREVRDRHQAALDAVAAEKAAVEEVLLLWAKSQRDTWGKRKSLVLLHGILGFRYGPPKLELLPSYSWPDVLQNLRLAMPHMIRVEEVPNKDQILLDAQGSEPDLPPEDLALLGLSVTRKETFYLMPK